MNPKDHSRETLLIAPALVTHGETAAANLDTADYGGPGYATIRVLLSSELDAGATGPTISLLESDDTVVTNFATIVADQSGDLTAAKTLTYHVDLRGRQRYIRVTVTPPSGTTNNNVTVGATGALSSIGHGGTTTTDNVVV